MKVGITTFVTDRSISPAALARAAEERGYHSLYLPEHTHLPVAESTPPALVAGVELDDYRRTMDPFVALAAAATVTDRILIGTGVCLVAQHDPIVLAKQVATLDHIANGRFVLGVGYGWNRQEAADHGVDFASRRQVAEANLRRMQAFWSLEVAEGSYSWPKPVQQPRVRTLFGAPASASTFRTVVALGDGWMPIGGSGLAEGMSMLRDAADAAGREPLDVVPFGSVPDESKLDHFRELGVAEVVLRIPSGDTDAVMRSLDDYSKFIP